MKRLLLFLLCCLLGTSLFGHTVPLNSEQGLQRLQSSLHQPYLELKDHYEPQLRLFCHVASSVMVLNTLGLRDENNQPFNQTTFFTRDVSQVKTLEAAHQKGITFEELVQALRSFPQLNVSYIYASQFPNPESLALTVQELMQTKNLYVIAYINRRVLNQRGWGHYSPVAAYDANTNSVLIFDVNKRVGPFWVDVPTFWQSMQDYDRGLPRGLILISLK